MSQKVHKASREAYTCDMLVIFGVSVGKTNEMGGKNRIGAVFTVCLSCGWMTWDALLVCVRMLLPCCMTWDLLFCLRADAYSVLVVLRACELLVSIRYLYLAHDLVNPQWCSVHQAFTGMLHLLSWNLLFCIKGSDFDGARRSDIFRKIIWSCPELLLQLSRVFFKGAMWSIVRIFVPHDIGTGIPKISHFGSCLSLLFVAWEYSLCWQ